MKTKNKIPWLFPEVTKFPDLQGNSLTFPGSEKDWNFPDFSLTMATVKRARVTFKANDYNGQETTYSANK